MKASFRLLHLLTHDRFEIAIGDLAFAVCEIFETSKGLIKILSGEVVAQLFQASPHGTAAAEFAQRDAVIAEAHGAGIDDLVGEPIF